MSDLPDNYRRGLVLALNGADADHVAAELGIEVASVRPLLVLASRKLDALIADDNRRLE